MNEFEMENVKENGIFIKYLNPIYGTQKSFYKKAKIISYNGAIYLQSYETIVAKINNGEFIINGWFSRTTAMHINEFLLQNGFEKLSKKQIQKLSV